MSCVVHLDGFVGGQQHTKTAPKLVPEVAIELLADSRIAKSRQATLDSINQEQDSSTDLVCWHVACGQHLCEDWSREERCHHGQLGLKVAHDPGGEEEEEKVDEATGHTIHTQAHPRTQLIGRGEKENQKVAATCQPMILVGNRLYKK